MNTKNRYVKYRSKNVGDGLSMSSCDSRYEVEVAFLTLISFLIVLEWGGFTAASDGHLKKPVVSDITSNIPDKTPFAFSNSVQLRDCRDFTEILRGTDNTRHSNGTYIVNVVLPKLTNSFSVPLSPW